MTLELYHGWRSSASRRVRLVLAEKGLPWVGHEMDLLRGDQHDSAYLALNPAGVVPALVHDGRVVCDSAVIAEYLDECFPQPPLLPAEPYARAQLRTFVRWIDEQCLPHLIIFNWSLTMQPAATAWTDQQLAERLARVPSASRREAWTRVARQPYTDAEKAAALRGLLALADRMLRMLDDAGGPWLMGAAYTLADIAAVPFVMRIREIHPAALDERPALAGWWAAAQARPAFAAARIEPFIANPRAA